MSTAEPVSDEGDVFPYGVVPSHLDKFPRDIAIAAKKLSDALFECASDYDAEVVADEALAALSHVQAPAEVVGEFVTLRAANEARQAEWDTGSQITPLFRATELAGEVGEAMNVIKKIERERMGIKGSRDTLEHLGEELADIVICTDLVAMDYGINLSAAVTRKFNATSEKVGLSTRLTSPATQVDEAMVERGAIAMANENYAHCGATWVQLSTEERTLYRKDAQLCLEAAIGATRHD